MKFNINGNVKVKLTAMGHSIDKARHMKFYHDYLPESTPDYVPVVEDENGWSTWQLWILMQQFGDHLFNGAELPFEPDIEICND